jgi:SAM-dependent methyltransferase
MNPFYIDIALICVCIWMIWILYNKIKPCTEKNALVTTLKKHPNWKRIKKTEQLLSTIFKEINAKHISRLERTKNNITEDSFVYGEIDFLSFFSLLEKTRPQPGEVFYDLGSGSGKAVFTAALHYDFSKVIGIEFLKGLHSVATDNIKKAEHIIKTHDRYFIPTYQQRISTIDFSNGNFLEYDISDGDIIFINATCFHYYLWEKIIESLALLKSGSRIIVTSKKIQNPAFELLQQSIEVMSWGLGSVNIYIKK